MKSKAKMVQQQRYPNVVCFHVGGNVDETQFETNQVTATQMSLERVFATNLTARAHSSEEDVLAERGGYSREVRSRRFGFLAQYWSSGLASYDAPANSQKPYPLGLPVSLSNTNLFFSTFSQILSSNDALE